MNADIIYEVIMKLVGEIEPRGDASIDHSRLENTKILIDVFDKIHSKLDDVEYRYKDSPYHSEKIIASTIEEYLNKLQEYE